MCYDWQLGLVVQTQTSVCDRVISDTVVDAGEQRGRIFVTNHRIQWIRDCHLTDAQYQQNIHTLQTTQIILHLQTLKALSKANGAAHKAMI